MQYDVETPEDYLAALDQDWRRPALMTIRGVLKEAAPELSEGIGHKMLRYSDANGPVLHLNAQKGFVGLYLGDIDALDPDGSLTAGIGRGKGCLRFTKAREIDTGRLARLLERVMTRRRAGDARSC